VTSPPILPLDDCVRVKVTTLTASVVGGDEVVLVLLLVEDAGVVGERLVLEVELPISWKQTRGTYEEGVSLVVKREVDEVDTVVVVGAVTITADLNASYFVVADLNTWAIGSVSVLGLRGGQSPGSAMSVESLRNCHDARIGCGSVH